MLAGGIIIANEIRATTVVSPTFTNVSGSSSFDTVVSFTLKDVTNVSTDGTSQTTIGNALFSGTGTTRITNAFAVESPSIQIKTNVFRIDENGNTTINGALKVGYLPNTIFNTSSNATLDISGVCAVSQNILLSGNIISQSDRNIKTNIIPIEDCLEKINNMYGYRYNRIDLNDNRTHIGLIAQEIEEIFPELVTETNNIKGINYQGFIAILLNCIKELNKKIESKK
jgi:hypothetical protein